ncbi:MAG: queuosine salvage family protein [Candidatus Acidiferrales bacterium]
MTSPLDSASQFPSGAAAVGGVAVRWPKSIGSPVLDSLRPVIERSRDVRTNVDKIVEVAGWMAYEELPMPEYAVPFGIGANDPEVAMDFILVADSLDTAFTDFATHIKFQTDYAGRLWSDSEAEFACLNAAMNKGVPVLDGNFLAQVSRAELANIFAGNIEMPMLDEKLEVAHQVGGVLAAKYGGRFSNWVKSCSTRLYDKGNGLVERMATEFPRFNDVSRYDGHEIKFYKLPQLGLWMLYTNLHQAGHFQLDDLRAMTAFADYIVPVALRLMGMTSYSPALDQAINTYQMIPRDSTQEIELRAHCIYATALLSEEINARRAAIAQVIIPQIDARLWTHYHTTAWPHHMTRTIMY